MPVTVIVITITVMRARIDADPYANRTNAHGHALG
jgi:hypothetical protein